MTIATEIKHLSLNANEAFRRSEDAATAVDQDWEHEATLYTFADDSVLLLSGPQVNTYDSIKEARKALCE